MDKFVDWKRRQARDGFRAKILAAKEIALISLTSLAVLCVAIALLRLAVYLVLF